jgi:hypothetical protein
LISTRSPMRRSWRNVSANKTVVYCPLSC